MESEVLTNLKKQSKGKKPSAKPETAEVETTNESGETEGAVETAPEEEEEEVEQEFTAPPASASLFLPKAKCQACLFLLPTLPVDTLFKGAGLPARGVKPKEFDCFTEDVCPARNFQMVYDPLTEERVRKVFQEYLDTGNISLLGSLYEEAEDIGEASHARLHDLITGLMEEIQSVTIDEDPLSAPKDSEEPVPSGDGQGDDPA